MPGLLAALQHLYEKRGVTLCCVAGKYQFRTASDLAFLLRKEKPEQKRLSRAAIETLAIIAYHQPVTRAEIEDIRGVAMSKGTVDTLMEVGWVKIRGRKRTPGRPVTYGTTEAFLVQFGLESVSHLPGLDELKAAGFLEAIPPAGLRGAQSHRRPDPGRRPLYRRRAGGSGHRQRQSGRGLNYGASELHHLVDAGLEAGLALGMSAALASGVARGAAS